MTKKEFKSRCSFHTYVGWNGSRIRINAIFFDWKSETINGVFANGYKYMVKADYKQMNKTELFNVLYDWVTKEVQPSYKVEYRYAETDDKRFKVPLSIK